MNQVLDTEIFNFLKTTFSKAAVKKVVLAVSGGIDSAVSLTLATRSLGAENIFPILLPYDAQTTKDSQLICEFNHIPKPNLIVIDISKMVDLICSQLHIKDRLRRGNIMARVRMITIYDFAKQKNALVVGTENKSEKYLGYYTRFGDEASDVEPLQHLYKTEVYQLAEYLQLPEIFLTKSPSAGLWEEQTDEQELGFTYANADQIIAEYLGEKSKDPKIDEQVRNKVLSRIQSQSFKLAVPYHLQSDTTAQQLRIRKL